MGASSPGLVTKNPSAVRSPVSRARSRSSTSLVTRLALRASVRAITTVSAPMTSAASLAARSVARCCDVGTRTLPPMWPHFLAELSWSSKWTPAAPDSIIAFMSS